MAAAIAALYPNTWMSDSLIMSETIAMALVTAAILAALRHRDRYDLRSALLTGLVVGIAGLARSELLVLAPLFALDRRALATAARLVDQCGDDRARCDRGACCRGSRSTSAGSRSPCS